MSKKSEATQKGTSGEVSFLGHRLGNDGVDHINIYSNGKTELGRILSHFAHTPFVHPYFGPFYSMEGFWYWARSGQTEDRLRYLSGFRAKQVGKALGHKRYQDFKSDILAANYQKIIQHEKICEMVIDSTLPFDHYYVFGPNNIHITPQSSDWLLKGFEDIRLALQEGEVPSVWTEAEKRYVKR